jgi:hypothetical protein
MQTLKGALVVLGIAAVTLAVAMSETGTGTAFAAPSRSARSGAEMTSAPTHTVPAALTPPAWVMAGAPYVHLLADGVATLDPAIEHAGLDSHLVAQVRAAVQAYDALPLSVRQAALRSPAHTTAGSYSNRGGGFVVGPNRATWDGGGGCTAVSQATQEWYGVRLYVNSCAISDIQLGLLGGATLAGFISLVCAEICAPIAGAIALAMLAYIGWLQWANDQCGNEGAYLNYPEIPIPGGTWVSTVC